MSVPSKITSYILTDPLFTQSAIMDGGAFASWRMEAPPSDCVNRNNRPSARFKSSYKKGAISCVASLAMWAKKTQSLLL